MPLVTGGRAIGALVVDMRRPRFLDQDEVRLLRLMANQAALAIEKDRQHQEEIKRRILEQELAVAQQIQLSLLPKALPEIEGWEFAAFYQAAHQIGGDFYDLFDLPGEPRRLGLVIGDVSGKGVPAALFMTLSRTLIRTAALDDRRPSAALNRAGGQILKENRTGQFVSVCYATLDIHSGRLAFANAGHNPPLWVQGSTGQVRELEAPGIILGVFDEIALAEGEIEMATGDLLIFFTDAVTEAMDSRREMFGEERLQELAGAHAQASAAQMLETVINAFQTHTGHVPLADDITLLVVKRCPGLAENIHPRGT